MPAGVVCRYRPRGVLRLPPRCVLAGCEAVTAMVAQSSGDEPEMGLAFSGEEGCAGGGEGEGDPLGGGEREDR